VRNTDDCKRQCGRELALNGRVNRGEPLINVVRTNKPKTLRGLSQKGKWLGVRVSSSLTVDATPPANRRDLPHSRIRAWNVVSPHVSRKGKRTVRGAERRGGMGRWRKRMPLCNGADRDPCPTRKRADFHLVFPYENAWQTDPGGKADDGSKDCWCGFPRSGGVACH
jgi:hypothetical protein